MNENEETTHANHTLVRPGTTPEGVKMGATAMKGNALVRKTDITDDGNSAPKSDAELASAGGAKANKKTHSREPKLS